MVLVTIAADSTALSFSDGPLLCMPFGLAHFVALGLDPAPARFSTPAAHCEAHSANMMDVLASEIVSAKW